MFHCGKSFSATINGAFLIQILAKKKFLSEVYISGITKHNDPGLDELGFRDCKRMERKVQGFEIIFPFRKSQSSLARSHMLNLLDNKVFA